MRSSQKHPFDVILAKIRKESKDTVELGTKFEKITKNFLETDTQYKKRFKDVTLWKNWKYNGGRPDTGIDLMATEKNGNWCAIQCKCYADDGGLDLKAISTFFATTSALGKQHKKTINTILVYTGDYITSNAEKMISAHQCHIIEQTNFRESSIMWNKFPKLRTKKPKTLYPHQENAFNDVTSALKTQSRGKMIMACGTGKTLTSLRIAEKHAGIGKIVLYLVPSISLIHQTMREWSENAMIDHHYTVVCSDKTVGDEGQITDLAIPPTTDTETLRDALDALSKKPQTAMRVIFSTYHSIEVVSKAMNGDTFDLVLCDEAHRTTGVEQEEKNDRGPSYFTKVHDDKIISAKRRVYMTATPRVYSEAIKNGKVGVHSMDDEQTFGKDMHCYSFSDAVTDKELADFKVRVAVIPEKELEKYTNESIDDEDDDGKIDERVLLAAVWHGLNHDDKKQRPLLQRVIAFSNRITASRQFAGPYDGNDQTQDEEKYIKKIQKNENESTPRQNRSFDKTVSKYEENNKMRTGNTVSVRHVDGTMRAHVRNIKMRWLKDSNDEPNTCRILSNARCLSEGVDVPALDGVIFLHPRKSKVDVIQSVGRVMRKARGKKYGHVILPVVIPAGMSIEESLIDKKAWKAVWQVLVALRSHDPNFANVINRLNLEPGGGGTGPDDLNVEIIWMGSLSNKPASEMFGKIVTKMVEKVGDRKYFDDKSEELGKQARNIRGILDSAHKKKHPKITSTVLTLCNSLRAIVNDSVTESETIDVLAQHHALSQVFDALFEKRFRTDNPVASALDEAIKNIGLSSELKEFEEYYDEVRKEAQKFKTVGGKQNYIKTIYGNFLKGFDKKGTEQHGVVFTPVEVVDFIINSVEHILRTEFDTGFNRNDVKMFDPFVGTGMFMTRLLESGLIKPSHLQSKYQNDLYANEMSLLAYYVAMVNIESVYGVMADSKKQLSFPNINYTDTLNHNPRYRLDVRYRRKHVKFGGDIGRIQDKIQKTEWSHIHVIIGNPPYSVGQGDYSDDAKNNKYRELDKRISDTYIQKVKMINKDITNTKILYDSYIRSIRWASDRIGNSGIVAFITNATFIRSEIAAGLRASLEEEFTDVWCFDLRGDAYSQGETRKKEGGGIFGTGSRTPVAITILVKNPKKEGCTIHYKDIGDCLDREEKLEIIKNAKSIQDIKKWQTIKPDIHHDWIDKRNKNFGQYTPIGSKDVKSDGSDNAIFKIYSRGISSSRDVWAYNSSKKELTENMKKHIDYCDSQKNLDKPKFDSKQAKWTGDLSEKLKKHRPDFDENKIRISLYRPLFKQLLYFDSTYNTSQYQIPKMFPNDDSENLVISVPYKFTGESYVFITDITPDLEVTHHGQCFPLYTYDHGEKKENILNSTLSEYQTHYDDKNITKKDIFYYVYGLLHHKKYKTKFANNLTREYPHIPMAPDFRKFSKAGKNLADLHLNFETCKRYPLGKPKYNPENFAKLSFARKTIEVKPTKTAKKNAKSKSDEEPAKTKNITDKTTIRADGTILFDNLPEMDYKVNGRTPIEWIIDRYQKTVDKDSGITNDPCTNTDIIAVIERATHIGVESDKIINDLSTLDFEPKNYTPRKTGMDQFTDAPHSQTMLD